MSNYLVEGELSSFLLVYFWGESLVTPFSLLLYEFDLVSGLMCVRLALFSFDYEQHPLVTTPILFFYLLYIIEGINNEFLHQN